MVQGQSWLQPPQPRRRLLGPWLWASACRWQTSEPLQWLLHMLSTLGGQHAGPSAAGRVRQIDRRLSGCSAGCEAAWLCGPPFVSTPWTTKQPPQRTPQQEFLCRAPPISGVSCLYLYACLRESQGSTTHQQGFSLSIPDPGMHKSVAHGWRHVQRSSPGQNVFIVRHETSREESLCKVCLPVLRSTMGRAVTDGSETARLGRGSGGAAIKLAHGTKLR